MFYSAYSSISKFKYQGAGRKKKCLGTQSIQGKKESNVDVGKIDVCVEGSWSENRRAKNVLVKELVFWKAKQNRQILSQAN